METMNIEVKGRTVKAFTWTLDYDDFDGDDEGDACDWENPDRVEAL